MLNALKNRLRRAGLDGKRFDRKPDGFSLIELLIAMTVLGVGLLACMGMILAGVQSNTRNKNDTSAVVLDQEILEQFATYKNYPTTGFVAINDCGTANSTHNASVVEGPPPNGNGATLYTAATAPLPNQIGQINWTAAAPALATAATTGYAMDYQTCNGDTFEVRWNVMQVTPNAQGISRISILTVSSRQISAASAHNATLYATPTTLQTMIESN